MDVEWREHRTYELVGTYVELIPNAVGGWFIVDRRVPDRSRGKALLLDTAKKQAVGLVERDPDLLKSSDG